MTARVDWYPCSIRASRSVALEVPRVSVDTEDLLQHLHLLADARVGAGAFEEGGHDLGPLGALRGGRGFAQPGDRLTPAAGVARPPYVFETGHLLPLYLRIDLEDRDRRLLCRRVRIDADDELLFVLDLLLKAEGGGGDL